MAHGWQEQSPVYFCSHQPNAILTAGIACTKPTHSRYLPIVQARSAGTYIHMIALSQLACLKRCSSLFAGAILLTGLAQPARADTIVRIDFDETSDLTSLFNADSSPYLFNQTSDGLANSGVVNSAAGQNTGDIWTSKTGYSVSGPGDTYRLSAFFRTTGSRGHSGLGIATSNVNNPVGSGNTSSGIGYISTDSTVTILSSEAGTPAVDTYQFDLENFQQLFEGDWYHFEVTIVSKSSNSFDVTIAISTASPDGTIGAVLATVSQSNIVNNDVAQANTIHPYLSVNATSGSRFDRVDDLTMRLSGGAVVVPDPEADTDEDGQLDTIDEDDDGDGTNDEADTFPLDENETNDNDGDGIGDVEDTDDDNDGTPDEEDPTPFGGTLPDSDNDGIADVNDDDDDNDGTPDSEDAFPFDPMEQSDTDGDGTGNVADEDDDGDGTPDSEDAFPLDPEEQKDTDNDGTGDVADDDDDGDGTPDDEDAFPLNPDEQSDTDGDGMGNVADNDDDGDGTPDSEDAFPLDPNEQADTDGDGTGDVADNDDDGDGTTDANDAFPLDPNEQTDTDGDGTGNVADVDDDGDGAPDADDAFPLNPDEQLDSDLDGIGDNSDPTPFGDIEPGQTDTDEDGVSDQLDQFPEDASEWYDSDDDGVGNNADAFPFDATETQDSDDDGVGNNADVFPNDATEQTDFDGDGIGDNADPDNDNDGALNAEDAFPFDPEEQLDTDADGTGNVADSDDDNDGLADNLDAFPLDPRESVDTDNDGLGNNADSDDDNDGVDDVADAFPLEADEALDTDNDGMGNNSDSDDDNDGYSDIIELEFDSDPLNVNVLPQGLDMDRDSLADSLERGRDADGDGIGNEFDVDSDNDGIFDLIEASEHPADAAALDSDGDGSIDSTHLLGLTRINRPVDSDNDGIHDFLDLDSDNDGIADNAELPPSAEDFVLINDLQNDHHSVSLSDPDSDRLVNYRDLDSDNDGIPDLVEAGGDDTDGNGIADNFLDINADGLDDGLFLAPLILQDSDADGTLDYLDLDSNNDGVFDIASSGLIDADLNSDGMLDISTDSNNNGIFDYADAELTNGPDTDNDGIDDRIDASVLNAPDADSDGIADAYDADSQGDGLIQIVSIAFPEETVIEPVTEQPVSVAPTESPEPTTPEASGATPEAEPVATIGVNGGGCSISGPTGQPDIMLTTLLVFSLIYLTLLRVGTWRTIKSSLIIFLSTCLAAGPTLADIQTGLYLGIGAGASRLMPNVSNAELDDRDSVGNSWTATAGYQFTRRLGLELEYSDLGTTVLNPIGYIDYQDTSISGVYHLDGLTAPFGGKKYSLYGRLGLGTLGSDSNMRVTRGSDIHWLAGAGIQMPISSNLSLRAEGVNYDADVNRFGLSLVYQMGRPPLPTYKALKQRILQARNAGDSESDSISESEIMDSDNANTLADASVDASADATINMNDLDSAEASKNPDATSANAAGSSVSNNDLPYVLHSRYHEPHKDELADIGELMKIAPIAPPRVLVVGSPSTQSQPGEKMLIIGDAQTTTEKISVNDTITTVDTLAKNEALPDKLDDFDRSTISAVFQRSLQPLIDYLRNNADASVTLTGHTDNIGSEEYNQMLSVQRAKAVQQFLLQQGIDKKMIRALGMGEKQPVRSNDRLAGRKANRRVAIVVD